MTFSTSSFCRGKVIYGTAKEARDVCRRVNRRRGDGVHAFYCHACNGYHAGRDRVLSRALFRQKRAEIFEQDESA